MKYVLDCDSNEKLIRSIIDFNGSGTISLKDEIVDWLNDNTVGWKYNGVITLHGEYNEGLEFEFLNEYDVVAFKLRWI